MTQDAAQNAAQPPVLTTLENGVFTITLNRPEVMNAANDTLLYAMIDAFNAAERDPAARAVVVTGSGRAFCSGADLKAARGVEVDFKAHLEHTFNPLILKMRTIEKPVITAVNGVAAGAGASIALAGDIRVWSENASFIELFSKIGLIPDAGSTWLLPRLVGWNRAYDLMVHAEKVSPEDGLRMGLCERVYAADGFADRVRELAEGLAAGPTRCFGLTKRAMNKAMSLSLPEALECEAMTQQVAGSTADHKEGLAAFAEKRAPLFKGE